MASLSETGMGTCTNAITFTEDADETRRGMNGMGDMVWPMTVLFVPAVFWGVVFLVSYHKEPRQFRNAIWLAFALVNGIGALTFLLLGMTALNESVRIAFIIALVVLIMIAPVAVIVFLLANSVVVVRREGMSISTVLPALLAGLLIVCLVLDAVMLANHTSRWLIYVVMLVTFETLWAVFTLAALLLYSTLYRLLPRHRRYDYIIIHGAGLQGDKPTPLLRGRIDKAVQLWNKQEGQGLFIASGGKGNDEVISEAEAMRRYLRDGCSVPDKAILTEDRSTTTRENLVYSKAIMDARSGTGKNAYRAALVTSDYHVFRACEYAHAIGLNADGVGSRTTGYYWPTAFIREFVAISRSHWWPYAVIAVVWTLIEAIA